MWSTTKYVSQEGAKKLPTYTYRGEDRSKIYKHVLTPLNNYLINFFPLWLAPNTITLTGLIIVAITHGMMHYYSPNFDQVAPGWAYVSCGIALLIYQTLDNLDGKQARRTGSSSPLGLLFDHGCDALNCTIGSLTVACTILTGPTWKAAALWAITAVPFYFATWEEYFTGELILPVINGPTEGVIFASLTHILTGLILPSHFWVSESFIQGIQWNTIYISVGGFLALISVLSNIYNVISAILDNKRHPKKDDGDHHPRSLYVAFTRLIPFLLLQGMAAIWIVFSPGDIIETHPRIVLWTLGLLFAKMVTHIMISHLCSERHHPLRKTLIPLFFLGFHAGFGMLSNLHPLIPEELVLKEFFVLSLGSYVHLVFSTIREITNILNISCFSITPKKTQ